MKTKRLLLGAMGLAAGMVGACHDDHGSSPSPPPQTTQAIDTAQVLTMAQQSSETSSPIVVNGGAIAFDDTSDSKLPIAVNAM